MNSRIVTLPSLFVWSLLLAVSCSAAPPDADLSSPEPTASEAISDNQEETSDGSAADEAAQPPAGSKAADSDAGATDPGATSKPVPSSASTTPAKSESANPGSSSVASRNTSPADPSMDRDYDFQTPLPATGTVTQRRVMEDLALSELIADCPSDSAPYAFAESTNFFVQVCSEEYDPWQPKYYIGQAKDGGGTLEITSNDPDEARQLIFRNGDYTYALYRDGARPDQLNAYLEVYTPDGDDFAEALLRIYERPQP